MFRPSTDVLCDVGGLKLFFVHRQLIVYCSLNIQMRMHNNCATDLWMTQKCRDLVAIYMPFYALIEHHLNKIIVIFDSVTDATPNEHMHMHTECTIPPWS